MNRFKNTKFRSITKKILVRLGFGKKPDFLIIGAQKAGTTLLYSYLSQHPSIVRPVFKEAHFFDIDSNFRKGYKAYYMNFQFPFLFKKGEITFEATPDYLYYEKCPIRIKSFASDIKLIVILRDPVERAFSAWKMHHFNFKNHSRHYNLYDPRSFEEAIESEMEQMNNQDDVFSYISRGIYFNQLSRYMEAFGSDKILVLDNLELRQNPQQVLDKISKFLLIPKMDSASVNKEDMFWENVGTTNVSINKSLMEHLKAFYKPHNEKLEKLLKLKFSWS